jgi:anthranilate synthase/aminodeoxychorismate synthase-like glutamine amidotransferase
VRNDAIDAGGVLAMNPDAVVLSPGPCAPQQAGCSLDVVRRLAGRLPILGICLGHQAIGEAFGGRVVRARQPMHGRASQVFHNERGLFAGLPNPLVVGRYHSLILEEATLPKELAVTARTGDGTIMALEHCRDPVVGLQFHPESILTDCGFELLAGFLRLAGISPAGPLPTIDWERPTPLAAAFQQPAGPVTF